MAFLIMTGEDEQPDGTLHARSNVIHEIGLFKLNLVMKGQSFYWKTVVRFLVTFKEYIYSISKGEYKGSL